MNEKDPDWQVRVHALAVGMLADIETTLRTLETYFLDQNAPVEPIVLGLGNGRSVIGAAMSLQAATPGQAIDAVLLLLMNACDDLSFAIDRTSIIDSTATPAALEFARL